MAVKKKSVKKASVKQAVTKRRVVKKKVSTKKRAPTKRKPRAKRRYTVYKIAFHLDLLEARNHPGDARDVVWYAPIGRKCMDSPAPSNPQSGFR